MPLNCESCGSLPLTANNTDCRQLPRASDTPKTSCYSVVMSGVRICTVHGLHIGTTQTLPYKRLPISPPALLYEEILECKQSQRTVAHLFMFFRNRSRSASRSSSLNSRPLRFGLRQKRYGYNGQPVRGHTFTSYGFPQLQSRHFALIAFTGVSILFSDSDIYISPLL